jgi:hypothetical protein
MPTTATGTSFGAWPAMARDHLLEPILQFRFIEQLRHGRSVAATAV